MHRGRGQEVSGPVGTEKSLGRSLAVARTAWPLCCGSRSRHPPAPAPASTKNPPRFPPRHGVRAVQRAGEAAPGAGRRRRMVPNAASRLPAVHRRGGPGPRRPRAPPRRSKLEAHTDDTNGIGPPVPAPARRNARPEIPTTNPGEMGFRVTSGRPVAKVHRSAAPGACRPARRRRRPRAVQRRRPERLSGAGRAGGRRGRRMSPPARRGPACRAAPTAEARAGRRRRGAGPPARAARRRW